VWRNIQLLFIDTHIFTHWFIDNDETEEEEDDDDDDDDDSVPTKKDYIKDTNSYINIYIGLYINVCMYTYIYVHRKRNTSSELVVVVVVIGCCVITTIRTLYTSVCCSILNVSRESITICIYTYIIHNFTHHVCVSCVVIYI